MRHQAPRPGAKLLSIRDASLEYGIAEGTLRALIASRTLTSVELPGVRRVLIARAALDELIEKHTK